MVHNTYASLFITDSVDFLKNRQNRMTQTCCTGWPAHACASAAVASPAALVARPGCSPSNVCISCWPAVVSVDGADAVGTEPVPPAAATWLTMCCWGWFNWDEVDWPPDLSRGFFLGLGFTRSEAWRPVVLRYVCNSSLYAIWTHHQTAAFDSKS